MNYIATKLFKQLKQIVWIIKEILLICRALVELFKYSKKNKCLKYIINAV